MNRSGDCVGSSLRLFLSAGVSLLWASMSMCLFPVEIIWRILPYLYIRNIISWRYLHYYICRYPRITSHLSVYINPPDPCSNASAVYSHL